MSYILDALQKADTARGPGLAQPARGLVFAPTPRPSGRRVRYVGAAGLMALAALVGGWWLAAPGRPAAPPPAAPGPGVPLAGVPATSARVPQPAASDAGLPPIAVAATPSPLTPAATQMPTADPAVAAPPTAPPPAAKTRARALPRTAGDAAPARNAQAAQAQPIASALPAPTAALAPPAALASGLPSVPAVPPIDQPAVQISGSSYSDNPAYRMLIINGRMFREGETVAPDLVLLAIEPHTAWLSYRGQRYGVNF